MRHVDRAIGIAIGLLLGIAIVVAFVFWGSGETIDAPSLSEDEPARERTEQPQPTSPPP